MLHIRKLLPLQVGNKRILLKTVFKRHNYRLHCLNRRIVSFLPIRLDHAVFRHIKRHQGNLGRDVIHVIDENDGIPFVDEFIGQKRVLHDRIQLSSSHLLSDSHQKLAIFEDYLDVERTQRLLHL